MVRGTKQLENVHASRALAGSRSNNSYSVAWLGSQADSTEALAFTDAISSTTNYFFHNETTDTIQRLVNSSYTGPTVEPHYRWLAIGGGGGAADGIADSLAFAVSGQEVTATLGRSVGADLTASFTVPGGGSGDDAFDWATVGNTDLVPTAKLGPGVANADRILRGSRTWGRINANMLTASFVDDDPPDEADYMLFADSGPGRLLSFRTYGSLLDGIASDIKTVTALPDPEDVDDADKDKLWLVVPTADTGVEEVAHFKPAGDTTVFTMTAADHTYGSGLHLVGTDKADRLGHLEPKTNLHDIYWEDTLDTYYIEFQDGSTSPFDYSNYTNGLSLYFREQGATGNWRRVFLAQQSDDNEFSSAEGVANHFVGGTVYDVIVRATSTTAGVHSVSSVPSTIRLEPHPGGGSFRSLVDEDELGQITTVTQEVRQVDGEVNDFTLAYASGVLTGTVERSIGADIVATAAIPEGLPLAGGTLTGDLIVDGAVEIERGATSGIALSITKTDTGGNPVVRMIHPDNTGNGQRPFNAAPGWRERLFRGERPSRRQQRQSGHWHRHGLRRSRCPALPERGEHLVHAGHLPCCSAGCRHGRASGEPRQSRSRSSLRDGHSRGNAQLECGDCPEGPRHDERQRHNHQPEQRCRRRDLHFGNPPGRHWRPHNELPRWLVLAEWRSPI